jgi:hypothetical protein
MKHRILFLLTLFIVPTPHGLYAATAEEAKKDIAQLEDYWNSTKQGMFQQFSADVSIGGEIEEIAPRYREKLDGYRALQKGDLGKLNEFMGKFEAKYGTNESAIDQAVNTALGAAPSRRTSFLWKELKEGLELVNQYDVRLAEKILGDVNRDMQHIDSFSDRIVDRKFQQFKDMLEVARELDPKNENVKTLLKSIDGQRKDANSEIEAKIEGTTWDPHSAHFNGPGNPDKLAAEVEKFLEVNDKGQREDNVIAVRIAGDWRVADKTLLGETLTYGLPVEVAWRLKDDDDNASVQSLTIVTRDLEKAAPFKNSWVGDSWRIRTSAIKGVGGSGPNGLFKLLLSATLILSGFLAIMPWMESKSPKVAQTFAPLKAVRGIVGVVTLGLGLLFFLLGLANPLSDLFPLAVAIVTGLFLGLELIISTSAQNAKAEELIKKGEGSIRKLAKVQVPLGWACLGLGTIHLMLGGLPLF